MIWEQSEISKNIPTYKLTIPITKNELILHIRGDEHIGLKCVDVDDLINECIKIQNKYKDNMFVISTGDQIENGLKRSIGHNYDAALADPEDQITKAIEMNNILDENLYGKNWKKLSNITRKNYKNTRHLGVLGNHEYRTRREASIWLNERLYGKECKGILDCGIHALVHLTLHNIKRKLKKTYIIYVAHRLSNGSSGKIPTLIRNFDAKKGNIIADIYVVGHYHKRFIGNSIRYNSNGVKEKIMYVANPSPADATEYGVWAQYPPNSSGYYVNIKLPIEKDKQPSGEV